MAAIQASHFQNNTIYPDMVHVLISIEGDLLACVNRVGVWGSSAAGSVTSEVGLVHVHDLNENSFNQLVSMSVAGRNNVQDHGSRHCLFCEQHPRPASDR